MRKSIILITGINGEIGHVLVEYLLEDKKHMTLQMYFLIIKNMKV